MATVSVSEARAGFAELLNRVEAGEEVTITRHDKPIAVVMAPTNVRIRRKAAAEAIERAAQLGRDLEAARHEPLSAGGVVAPELAEQWIRELRQERDEDPWTRSTQTS
jgi:prevent-host-death family protein